MRGGAALAIAPEPRRVLHAGCGRQTLPAVIFGDAVETRLDISAECKPDVVGSMADLGPIGPFDAVYCSHALEHLDMAHAMKALREFHRVLRPGGLVWIVVPDLEGVTPDDKVLFVSPAGPIRGIDVFWGFGPDLEAHPYMAHRCGFTADTLSRALIGAGFSSVEAKRVRDYNLVGVGLA